MGGFEGTVRAPKRLPSRGSRCPAGARTGAPEGRDPAGPLGVPARRGKQRKGRARGLGAQNEGA